MAHNQKALIFIIFGVFSVLLGTGVICGGGFNSVMQTPTNGPYRYNTATTTTSTTTSLTFTTQPAGGQVNPWSTYTATTLTPGPITNTNSNELTTLNWGHYSSLLKQYPELFNWAKLGSLQANSYDLSTLATGVAIADQVNRDSAVAYTRFHAGEQAWIFAFFFPLTLIVSALAFVAYYRKSGYVLSLVGVALSAFMTIYVLLIVVHYQNISFVPEVLNAFTQCGSNDNPTRNSLLDSTAYGTLLGPVPRRAWLCAQDWTYDNNFRTAANLVWGGAATCFVGYLALLVGFAYLVQPFVTPAPAFAAKVATATRGAALDFDDYSDYSETEY